MQQTIDKWGKLDILINNAGVFPEIANAYLFLASDEASYVTGALFSVDGGITVAKGNVGEQVPEALKKQPQGELALEHQQEGATEMR